MSHKAWAVCKDGKIHLPSFFRNQGDAQIHAGRRMLGSYEYRQALLPLDNVQEFTASHSVSVREAASRVWKAVKKRHPTARLMRVTVRL